MRAALDLDDGIAALRPDELISAILRAPVDLLWNGGIGTYVKASSEANETVGDRANDSLRIDAVDLRCRIVGEGGNLGLTQLARVEYAVNGGLIYTDAIDNSAGVDCSDHEVNIKIVLDQLVRDGDLTTKQRNELLVEMTDEVADLVLDDNRAQTLALMIARRQALPMVNVHARYLETLESDGDLDRSLEYLPTDKQIAERQSGRQRPACARVRRDDRLHEERRRRRRSSRPTSPIDPCSSPICSHTSRPRSVSAFPTRSAPTVCGARSSRPGSSTTWSTSAASRSTTG